MSKDQSQKNCVLPVKVKTSNVYCRNFQDGQAFSQKLIINSNMSALQLVLYHVGLFVVNPFVNQVSLPQKSGFYFLISNFSTKFLSLLKDMFCQFY